MDLFSHIVKSPRVSWHMAIHGIALSHYYFFARVNWNCLYNTVWHKSIESRKIKNLIVESTILKWVTNGNICNAYVSNIPQADSSVGVLIGF